MDSEKKILLGLLDDIKKLIEENEIEEGKLRFDATRAIVAPDFAKTEIEKSADKN